MNNSIIFTVVGAILFSFLFGLSVGHISGKDDACQSIGLEYAKGKCMKVTREDVK